MCKMEPWPIFASEQKNDVFVFWNISEQIKIHHNILSSLPPKSSIYWVINLIMPHRKYNSICEIIILQLEETQDGIYHHPILMHMASFDALFFQIYHWHLSSLI